MLQLRFVIFSLSEEGTFRFVMYYLRGDAAIKICVIFSKTFDHADRVSVTSLTSNKKINK